VTRPRPFHVTLVLIAALLCFNVVPANAQRSQTAVDKAAAKAQAKPPSQLTIETNEDLQPTVLAPLPVGMTIDMLVEGDRLFHGRGGCFACHGTEAQGLPAAGDGITSSLSLRAPRMAIARFADSSRRA
jgi:hypothetical protein